MQRHFTFYDSNCWSVGVPIIYCVLQYCLLTLERAPGAAVIVIVIACVRRKKSRIPGMEPGAPHTHGDVSTHLAMDSTLVVVKHCILRKLHVFKVGRAYSPEENPSFDQLPIVYTLFPEDGVVWKIRYSLGYIEMPSQTRRQCFLADVGSYNDIIYIE